MIWEVCRDCCLVDDICDLTVLVHRIVIVSVDDCFHVWHATIAYFSFYFFLTLFLWNLSGKVPLYQVDEESSNVGGDVFVVQRVEPDEVPFAVFRPLVPFRWRVFELLIVSRPLQCCSVVWLLDGRFLHLMKGLTNGFELILEFV